MQIDRRHLMTGLAATVAATSLPAMAAPRVIRDIHYRNFANFPIIDWDAAARDRGCARRIGLNSLWRLDWGDADHRPRRWLIRHVSTGYTYRRTPQSHDAYALQPVCMQTSRDLRADIDEVLAVGCAAYNEAPYAFCVLRHRSWHKGAVFFRLMRPRNPYFEPETWDAPRVRVCGEAIKSITPRGGADEASKFNTSER